MKSLSVRVTSALGYERKRPYRTAIKGESVPDARTWQYRVGLFSIIMLAELRDGSSIAHTVKVDANRLHDPAYQDDVFDRAADVFGRIIQAWEESAKKRGEAVAQDTDQI